MLPGEFQLLCLPPLPACLLLPSFRFKVLQAWVDSLRSLVLCVLRIPLTLLRPSVVLVPLLPRLPPVSFRFLRCSLGNLASAGDKWSVSVNSLHRNWNPAPGRGFHLIVNLAVIFCSAISAYLDGFDKSLVMQDLYHCACVIDTCKLLNGKANLLVQLVQAWQQAEFNASLRNDY